MNAMYEKCGSIQQSIFLKVDGEENQSEMQKRSKITIHMKFTEHDRFHMTFKTFIISLHKIDSQK